MAWRYTGDLQWETCIGDEHADEHSVREVA